MEKRFVFETTQGQVLDAMDEAALMDYVRIRKNALRPCAVVLALAAVFGGYFLLKMNWKTALYTLIAALILCGFFCLPLRGSRNFQEGMKAARAKRENLTNTLRAKSMRFVLEGDSCRMLDGKGEEVQAWDGVRMGEVRESGRLFWLPIADTSVLLPKSCMTEGGEDAFRAWLKAHSKRYRRCKVTERLRQKMSV